MTDELTPTQALALWGLLARQGRAPAAEVKKADRDALIAGRYAETDKASKTLSLTNKAWEWAGKHFDAPLPPAQRPLQEMLARLAAHLESSGSILAEFIGHAPPLPEPAAKPVRTRRAKAPPKEKALSEPQAAPRGKAPAKPKAPPKEKGPPRPKAPAKPKPPTAKVLRTMIEEAYLRASGGTRSEPVRLSRLRAELGGLDRKTVDDGLARIVKSKKETASLSQMNDNKAVDAAEREAAYSPAGEPFHLISIS